MEQKKKFRLHISHKTKRILLWVVLGFAGLNLLLLTAASIYASFAKQRLINLANTKLNEAVMGTLKVGDADITVWSTFPKIGVRLSNVVITDSVYNLPFLNAGTIIGKAGIFSLLGSELNINSVKIENAKVHTFIDSTGYTNSYVLKPASKPQPQTHKKKLVLFKDIQLRDVNLVSEDAIKNKRYEVTINKGNANISFKDSKYLIKFDAGMLVRGLGFNFSKGYWLENQAISAKWKFEFDTSAKTLSFNDTKVRIQNQPFVIKGIFYFKQPARFHIEANTKAIAYNDALAILKPNTRAAISKVVLKGPLDVNAVLDGPLAYQTTPLVNVDFATSNNTISTPVADFTNCNFSGNFINQVDANFDKSDSNSRVTVNGFTSKWGDVELKANNIVVTNLLKPVIKFDFFSNCTFPQLDAQLDLDNMRFVEGNANLYMSYNGPLIANPSLFDKLNAKIDLQNGKILYVPRNITFSECNGTVLILSNSLAIKDLQCNLNTNHFVVNVAVKNLSRLSGDSASKATLNGNIYVPALNLSDFKTLFAPKNNRHVAKRSNSFKNTAKAIDNLVENGDMFIDIKADKLSLDHFTANNVNASVFFKKDSWKISKASLQHADGNFKLSASVNPVSNTLHAINAKINLQNINIKKLFYGFDNFGLRGITYNNLKGIVDANANINVGINNAGKIVTNTMNGKINFSLRNAALINLKALTEIQKFIFKNRNLNYVEFADLKNTFTIQKGDITIPRMPIQSSAITMYIEGLYSFADRTDISIQIPFSTLKARPEDFKTIDNAKMNKPGASIFLRAKDKDGQVKIGLDLLKRLRKNKRDKSK